MSTRQQGFSSKASKENSICQVDVSKMFQNQFQKFQDDKIDSLHDVRSLIIDSVQSKTVDGFK